MDWVPMYEYGIIQTVNPNTQINLPLMDPATWQNYDEVVGRVEDENKGYRLYRIVGQYTMASGGENQLCMRIWPGFQQPGGTVAVPGSLVGLPEAQVANERFWWERRLGQNGMTTIEWDWMDPFTHPWWTTCDCRPNAWISEGETSVLSMYNDDALAAVRCRFYWRLLVSS